MNSSTFSTINPTTGEQIETFPFFTAKETEAALTRAEKSFQCFRKMCVHQRAELLSKLAATLRSEKAKLAKVITTEMGKILSEAESEVEKLALPLRFPSAQLPRARGGRLSCFLPGALQRRFQGSEASRRCGAAARRWKVARRWLRAVSRFCPGCRRGARACRLRPGTRG
jgi:hypothetical protein